MKGGAPVLSKKGIDRVSGFLLVGLAIATVLSIAMGLPDIRAEEFSKTFQGIVDNQDRQYLALVVLHVSSVLILALAAALYLAFRPFDPALAPVGAVCLVALGFTYILANVAGGVLANIAEEYHPAPAAQIGIPGVNAPVLVIARAVTMLQVFAWYVGAFTFLPLSLLAFGAIISRSGALPRWLGWLAIAAGIVMPTLWLSQHPFEIEAFYLTGLIGTIGALVWLLATGTLLMARGTREEASPRHSPLEASLQPAS